MRRGRGRPGGARGRGGGSGGTGSRGWVGILEHIFCQEEMKKYPLGTLEHIYHQFDFQFQGTQTKYPNILKHKLLKFNQGKVSKY